MIGDGILDGVMTPEEVEEYQRLRAQADDALGRWRCPRNGCSVVYRMRSLDGKALGRAVVVFNEMTGSQTLHYEGNLQAALEAWEPVTEHEAVAIDYFSEHPPADEVEPKPWHDVNPGDLLLLTVSGLDKPVGAVVSNTVPRRFEEASGGAYSILDPRITDADFIWRRPMEEPEEEE